MKEHNNTNMQTHMQLLLNHSMEMKTENQQLKHQMTQQNDNMHLLLNHSTETKTENQQLQQIAQWKQEMRTKNNKFQVKMAEMREQMDEEMHEMKMEMAQIKSKMTQMRERMKTLKRKPKLSMYDEERQDLGNLKRVYDWCGLPSGSSKKVFWKSSKRPKTGNYNT